MPSPELRVLQGGRVDVETADGFAAPQFEEFSMAVRIGNRVLGWMHEGVEGIASFFERRKEEDYKIHGRL